MAPLVDVLVFCAMLDLGASLRAGHMASFALAMALNYLLKVRSVLVSQGRTRDWRLHCRLGVVAFLALFLRGGVLGLLTLTWGWPAPLAIVPAVLAGWAIMVPGNRQVLTPAAGAAPIPLLGLVIYALALRLVYLGSVELLPEETYYWNYSRHLDIGYLDHPPMVAWLIRLGTAVFGQTAFGVRVGAYGCGIVASAFVYRLTRNLYGEASAPAALSLAQVLPYFFLSGLLMTPDAVLVAAWAASLYYLERALLAGRNSAWWGVGIALGVGCMAKYSIGLLVPVILAFMLWDPRARRYWRRWEPYGAALIALAIFSPVIVWNAQHDWASFAFQTSRRLAESPRFALHKLIAAALVLITPVGVVAIAAELWRSDADARRARFVRLAVLVPLTVFAIFSLRHEVKLDWTGAPWTAALPPMAAGMAVGASPLSGIRAWIRRAWGPTLLTVLLIYGAGLHYLVLGLPGLGYGKHIELIPVGWREFSRQIGASAAKVRAETGTLPLIVGMDRYAIASELAFYGGEHPALETSSAHLFDGVGLMYERWTPARLQEGRTLLLVAWEPADLTSRFVVSHAERLGPVEERVLTQDGQFVRHYYQRLAYNYRSVPSG
jgi:dolichol-phosphate mannosyltransferase